MKCNCLEDLCDICKMCLIDTTGIYFIITLLQLTMHASHDECADLKVVCKGTQKSILISCVNIMLMILFKLKSHFLIYCIGIEKAMDCVK